MNAFVIASAIVSIIIAIFAIWLSIVFYRMSVESSNKIEDSSKDLASSVDRLEKLFEHLYTDTFSMMRDTYSDMRKHIWSNDPDAETLTLVEERTDEKIGKIRDELMGEIASMASKAGDSRGEIEKIRLQFEPLITKAISETRNAESEAREETLRDFLLKGIEDAGAGGARAGDLFHIASKKQLGGLKAFQRELEALRSEGLVAVKGDSSRTRDDYVSPSTWLRLNSV
jgi:hypothetical protein